MERPMNAFVTKIRRLRSRLSARTSHRLAASLGVLLIAFAVLAATTAARHPPVSHVHGTGANLMLVPGFTGLAPALY
jgi:hypothetical protein